MISFKEWFTLYFPNEEIPKGIIPHKWFKEHGLPMVVCCYCCLTTLLITNCFVDEEDHVYCNCCYEEPECDDEDIVDKYHLEDLGNNWY